MAVRVRRFERIARPQEAAGIDLSNPIAGGLTAAYILRDDGRFGVNLVTGANGLTRTGTGGRFSDDGWYYSWASIGDFDSFSLGQSLTSTPSPITVLIVGARTSGVVSWSMQGRSDVSWCGWYGAEVDDLNSSNNNSFDGSITTNGAVSSRFDGGEFKVLCFSQSAANDLRACGFGTGVSADTSAAWPVVSGVSAIDLGVSARSAVDNASVSRFALIYVWNRVLSDVEKLSIVNNPWQLFEPEQIVVKAGAATGTYSASADESASATDAHSSSAVLAGALADTATASDADSSAAVLPSSVFESASASETPSSVATLPSSTSESGSASDTTGGLATFPSSITESASASDATNGSIGSATYNVSTSESASASDSSAAAAVFASSVLEAGSAMDAPGCAAVLGGVLAELASATDAIVVAGVFPAAQAEAAAASDSSNGSVGTQTYSVSVVEAAAAVDVLIVETPAIDVHGTRRIGATIARFGNGRIGPRVLRFGNGRIGPRNIRG